ncbi:9113_t:CDS:1, partial [Dentiscutata erythropus]
MLDAKFRSRRIKFDCIINILSYNTTFMALMAHNILRWTRIGGSESEYSQYL